MPGVEPAYALKEPTLQWGRLTDSGHATGVHRAAMDRGEGIRTVKGSEL